MSKFTTRFRRLLLCVAILIIAAPALAADEAAQPVGVIFDTDMGNDIDDALALAMIHSLQSRGECKLLAVTLSKDNEHAAPFVDLVNTFYGRGGIPIGAVREGVTPADGKYLKQVTTARDADRLRYPHDLTSGRDAPEAVALLRKTLAARPDGSVAIVMVGFSTNMARLLDSAADAISPLTGRELIKQKVRLLSAMAGSFSPELAAKHYKEFNVVRHIEPAQKVFAEWPGPVVTSGFEIGLTIKYPGRSIRDDYRYVKHHPLVDGYRLYRGEQNDQPTWDLTSVLYAVRPDRGYFGLSPAGRIVVEPDGYTRFQSEPKGNCRYLTVDAEQKARVKEALIMLSSQPPNAKPD